jgi:excisionase family DNA binding protein
MEKTISSNVRRVKMEKLLLRINETAQLIGLGKSKTYDLIARGELPSIRIGKSVRVPAEKLREWVNSRLASIEKNDEEKGL